MTEQPCISECACPSLSAHMYVFMRVHVCVVTCLHPLWPPAPPPYPPAAAPHLTPPCPALQALSQNRMRRGTVFHHCGGQSLRISQPSLGPSPLGSGAQQAPCSPPVDGGLWNEPPDSRLWRHVFVQWLWRGWGINDWLHLCVCDHAHQQRWITVENFCGDNREQPCCVRKLT